MNKLGKENENEEGKDVQDIQSQQITFNHTGYCTHWFVFCLLMYQCIPHSHSKQLLGGYGWQTASPLVIVITIFGM